MWLLVKILLYFARQSKHNLSRPKRNINMCIRFYYLFVLMAFHSFLAFSPKKKVLTTGRVTQNCYCLSETQNGPLTSFYRGCQWVEENGIVNSFKVAFCSIAVLVSSAQMLCAGHSLCLYLKTRWRFLLVRVPLFQSHVWCKRGKYKEEFTYWPHQNPLLCRENASKCFVGKVLSNRRLKMNKLKEKVKWNWTSARINENAVAEEQEKREMKRRGNRRVKQVCRLKMLTKLLVRGLWDEKQHYTQRFWLLLCCNLCIFTAPNLYQVYVFCKGDVSSVKLSHRKYRISSHRSFCTCCGMKAWQMEYVGCTCQSVVNFLVRVTSIATIPATLAPAWHHKVAKNAFLGGTGFRLASSTGVMLVEKQ